MKVIDFPDWIIVYGYEVSTQVERDVFPTFPPSQYDALLLVAKKAGHPALVELGGTIGCHGCGESYPFIRDVLLAGGGGSMLSCPNCTSKIQICRWSVRTLDGSLAEFAHSLEDASWITVDPFTSPRGSQRYALTIMVSHIGETKGQRRVETSKVSKNDVPTQKSGAIRCPNPNCGKMLEWKPEWSGKMARCYSCNRIFTFPHNESSIGSWATLRDGKKNS